MPPLHPGDPGEGGGDDHDPGLDQDVDEGELDDDASGFRPPLPPEDRVWRHPSEVALARSQAARRTRARRAAGAVLLSGGVGAAIAVGSVAIAGGDDADSRRTRPVDPHPATSVALEEEIVAADGAERATRSVAAITAWRRDAVVGGTAVVVRADGHLVTDAELVRSADRIEVVLHDGSTRAGELVGLDETTGLAVVRVDADGLEPVAMGGTGGLQVGAEVALVTTTSGRWSTEAGSVAATGRRIEGADGSARYGMIEVDSTFAAGSAGGALVDGRGAMVGLASSARPEDAGHGVATPVELVRHVTDQLVEHGLVRHVWLGLHGRDDNGGARVDDVVAGGPADLAGLRAGDLLVAVDGEATPSMAALIWSLRLHLPGDVVALTVQRDGAQEEVRVALAARDR